MSDYYKVQSLRADFGFRTIFIGIEQECQEYLAERGFAKGEECKGCEYSKDIPIFYENGCTTDKAYARIVKHTPMPEMSDELRDLIRQEVRAYLSELLNK